MVSKKKHYKAPASRPRDNRRKTVSAGNRIPASFSRLLKSINRTIFDEFSEGILLVDASLCVRYANEAAAQMLGYTVKELLRKPLCSFMDSASGRLQRACRGGRRQIPPGNYQRIFLDKDGNSRRVRMGVVPFAGTRGCSQGAIITLVAQDADRGKHEGLSAPVVHRRRIKREEDQEQFARRREPYDDIYNVAGVGKWEWYISKGIFSYSDTAGLLLGFKAGKFRTTYGDFLKCVHPDDRSGVEAALDECIKEGKPCCIEHRILSGGTAPRWVVETGMVFRLKQGAAVRVLGVIQDITALKKKEQEVDRIARFPRENPEPVMHIAWDGTIVYANPAAEEFLLNWKASGGGKAPDFLIRELLPVRRSGTMKRIEITGAGKTILFNAVPVSRKGDCNLYGFDITERKKIEEEREELFLKLDDVSQEAQKRASELNTIFLSFTDPVLIFDMKGFVSRVNKAAEESLGFSPLGMHYREFARRVKYKTTEGKKVRKADIPVVRAFEGAEVHGLQYRFQDERKEERVALISAGPIRRNERVAGIILIWHDITHRSKMEEYLRKSEKRYRFLYEESQSFNMTIGVDYTVRGVNESVLKTLGYRHDELIGKDITSFVAEHSKRIIRRNIRDGLAERATPQQDITFLAKDGAAHVIMFSAGNVILHEEEEISGIMFTGIDITQRKEAEEILKRDKKAVDALIAERTRQLLQAQKALQDAKRLSDIGTLAAIVAHELRNPLAAIHMATHNIKRKRVNPMMDKHIRNIEKKIVDSNQIINNLLFYARLKMPQTRVLDMYSLIEECVQTFQRQIHSQRIVVKKDMRSLRKMRIEADPLQMQELFLNILNNAVDSLPLRGGRIEITASAPAGNGITIEIRDNGKGMSAEVCAYAFEPFFTNKPKGTGLGLSVCKQIVDLHGGSIKLHSKEGQGTTVLIELPT